MEKQQKDKEARAMERLHLLLPTLGTAVRALALQQCGWDEERALTMLRRFQVSGVCWAGVVGSELGWRQSAASLSLADWRLLHLCLAGVADTCCVLDLKPACLALHPPASRWPRPRSCPSCTRSGASTSWRCRAAKHVISVHLGLPARLPSRSQHPWGHIITTACPPWSFLPTSSRFSRTMPLTSVRRRRAR